MIYEIVLIGIVSKNFPPFDTATNNVMQSSGCIDSGFSWHTKANSII